MNIINWRAEPSPVKIIRYCKKCSAKKRYHSSGMFRVNANRRTLDVWLIYKCEDCDNTWNCAIITRVNPENIDKNLLAGFHNNNSQLADKYSMDIDLLKRNGSEIEMPEYTIIGDDFDLSSDMIINVTCMHKSKAKLSKALRKKLGMSAKSFNSMVSNGVIKLDCGDILKARLNKNYIVVYNPINKI